MQELQKTSEQGPAHPEPEKISSYLPADGSIDAGLLVLEMITPYGETWTQQDIADICGCSKGYIWLLEKQARAKMRQRLQELRERGDIQ